MNEQEVEKYLKRLITKYCRMIENNIKVTLNGEQINKYDDHEDSFMLSLEPLPEGLNNINKMDVPIYVAAISNNEADLDYYWKSSSNEIQCIFEFYHNNLLIFNESLGYLISRADIPKVKISKYQLKRLDNYIIRIFLPSNLRLSVSKEALPYHWDSVIFIINQIIELVHPG
jgi:hypothetical protein